MDLTPFGRFLCRIIIIGLEVLAACIFIYSAYILGGAQFAAASAMMVSIVLFFICIKLWKGIER